MDDHRRMADPVGGERFECLQRAKAAEQRDRDHRNGFRQQAERRILNLKHRLDDCGDDTDGQQNRDDRRDRHELRGHRLMRKSYVKWHQAAGTVKLCASEPSTSTQPWIETNISNFKGSEIKVGETMIMPSDISTEATARSIRTKGM